ncbi:MAG: sulfite exporter TauE/SafE family protein [Lentisphaeria bacterium]|nr:sulfite exporter TauE/SafE family protein [Lentisphaeria bacterium]
MDLFFHDMTVIQIILLTLSAILIGINKTGIPGLGLVPVMMLIYAFPEAVGLSTGMQLLMLCAADVMAVAYYRRGADWKMVFRLLPCALAGLGVGYLTMEYFGDLYLDKAIGVIILLLSALNYIRRKYWSADKVPTSIYFTIGVGLAAGFTTMVANAAGPIMALYLLSMRFSKEKYIGTAAWYFMIMNWLKLPVFVAQDRITMDAFMACLPMIPFLMIGAVIGIIFLKKASLATFERIIEILVILGALKLLLPI